MRPKTHHPSGTVTFREGAKVLATVTLSGSIAKYSLKSLTVGEHTVTATYSGGPNNEPSESSSYTETIEP